MRSISASFTAARFPNRPGPAVSRVRNIGGTAAGDCAGSAELHLHSLGPALKMLKAEIGQIVGDTRHQTENRKGDIELLEMKPDLGWVVVLMVIRCAALICRQGAAAHEAEGEGAQMSWPADYKDSLGRDRP